MICRRCGNRIPEYLVTRESFQCPECGRQFGEPADARVSRGYEYEPRRYEREDRYADRGRRAPSRFEPEYPEDEGYYEEQYYDDGRYYEDEPPYEEYYDDEYYDDEEPYYDDDPRYYEDDRYYDEDQEYYDEEPYYDGEYYGEEPYDDEPYDGEPSDEDLSDLINGGRPRQPGMKLTTLLYVLAAELAVLIVVFCIAAGIDHDAPAATRTGDPVAVEATQQAVEGEYPTV